METLYSNQNQSINCPSSPNNSEQMISRYFQSRIRLPSSAMLMEKRLIFCIIIGEGDSNMDEMMMYGKRIPEYYDTMYLDGDLYFNTKYPGHNLVRARCQIALAKDMLKKMDEMNAVVRSCAAAAK